MRSANAAAESLCFFVFGLSSGATGEASSNASRTTLVSAESFVLSDTDPLVIKGAGLASSAFGVVEEITGLTASAFGVVAEATGLTSLVGAGVDASEVSSFCSPEDPTIRIAAPSAFSADSSSEDIVPVGLFDASEVSSTDALLLSG